MRPGAALSTFLLVSMILSATVCSAQVRTNSLVLSQLCPERAYSNGNVYDEFIELYNPTSHDIDLALSDYRIYKTSATGAWPGSIVCSFNTGTHFKSNVPPASTLIRAHGYYLVVYARASQVLLAKADAVASNGANSIAPDNKVCLTRGGTPPANIVDFVGSGIADEWEGSGPAPNPASGGSVIRKAVYSSTASSMSNGGSDTNHASCFDSDNNSYDFVRLSRIRPRNSSVHHDPFFIPTGISLSMTDVPSRNLSHSAGNTAVFALRYEETVGHFKLTGISMENRGSLTPGEISNVRLFCDRGIKASYDASDVFLASLTFNGKNAWTNNALTVTNNSELLVCMDLTASAVDSRTFRGCIPTNGIMIETYERFPKAMTNIMLAVTNLPPPAPSGFFCTSTNASSAFFRWDSYPAPGDFSDLIVYYGTNTAGMNDLLQIVTSPATNTSISSLSADRNWYFRLCARDSSGLASTNKGWIMVKTKADLNPPLFDDSTLTSTVNNKVVHLQWTNAMDPENSYPLKYLIYFADTPAALAIKPVSFTTTTNRYSFPLPAGTSYIRIKARDSFNNLSTNNGFTAVTVVETVNMDNVYFYPNPAGKGDLLRFNNFTDRAVFSVYNVRGEKILETREKSFTMPESVAAGVYYLVVRDGTRKKTKILVYQK